MPHYEPTFCTEKAGCHGQEVRCYLTQGQHREGQHKALCAVRDSRDHALHAHVHEWPTGGAA